MIQNLSIDFRSRGISLSHLLKAQSLSRLEDILAPFQGQLTSVKVRFVDENGPRGGVDQRCMIHLGLAGASPVYADATAAHPLQAFRVASDRIQTLLVRHAGRARAFAPLAS